MDSSQATPKVKAVLFEIKEALSAFHKTGKTWTIFVDKLALSFDERKFIRDFLGQGMVTVNFKDYAEPVEWVESGVAGVWYGVFFNNNEKPILETIEIAAFPELAAATAEDTACGIEKISTQLNSL